MFKFSVGFEQGGLNFHIVIELVDYVTSPALDVDALDSGAFIYNQDRYKLLCVIVFSSIFTYSRNIVGGRECSS